MTPEELSQGVSSAVTSPVTAPPVSLQACSLAGRQQRAPPLPVHVVVRQNEVSLGHRLDVPLHMAGDSGLLRVDLGALREHTTVSGSL